MTRKTRQVIVSEENANTLAKYCVFENIKMKTFLDKLLERELVEFKKWAEKWKEPK